MANESLLQATPRYEHEHEYEHEAVTQARQRVEMQRKLHGEDHPEFATGLNHLALLLIMHDAADDAEPLLHQALAIRKLALGEDHPDYATCLSSLGGLLWARGDLDAAEPLLHQAHDIRCRILGVNHPRTLASQSCLEQFLRMKGEQREHGQHEAGHELECDTEPERCASADALGLVLRDEVEIEPEAEVEKHAAPVHEDGTSHSTGMSSDDLAHELVVLSDVFTDLSERLLEAAERLQTPGLPPPDALIGELSSCRREFINLRDRTLALGQALHATCPPADDLTSLEDLTTLLNEMAETELRQSRGEEMRRRSLSVLDRVLRLTHVSDAGFVPLYSCQETASALHSAIANGPWNALPPEVEPLAEGEHEMAHLLTLVADGSELSDSLWAELHEAVGRAFGRSLADAAARGRLVVPQEHLGAASEEQ